VIQYIYFNIPSSSYKHDFINNQENFVTSINVTVVMTTKTDKTCHV